MATTNVLLREDIETLGGRGEIVKVKTGYARNYLLPRGLALLATKGNVKQVEQERTSLLKKADSERAVAQAQADKMQGIALDFERKSGDNGHLFGSVTSMDIAEALKTLGFEIDRRKIVLKDALKEVGSYTVNIKLHREVLLPIQVHISTEGGAAAEKSTKTPEAENSETAADDSNQ